MINDRLKKYEQTALVDMKRLLTAMLHKLWLAILSAVLCAALAAVGMYYLVEPQYQSAAMFYVNNNAVSIGGMISSFTGDRLRTARELVETYIVILNSRETLNRAAEYAGVIETAEEIGDRIEIQLAERITTQSVNETEIFRVTVTSTDPNEAERIANAIAKVLPERIAEIMDETSAKVVDTAVVPSGPSAPNVRNSFVLGGLFGFILAVGIIAMREMYDVTIHNETMLLQYEDIPILAAIPEMEKKGKCDRGRGYYRRS